MQVGSMVLVREDNLPPAEWSLGRILETYPDAKGHVRNILVKTAHGQYKRATQKLSALPIDSLNVSSQREQGEKDDQEPVPANQHLNEFNGAGMFNIQPFFVSFFYYYYYLFLLLYSMFCLYSKFINIL